MSRPSLPPPPAADLNEILAALQALRRGDFSKRVTAPPSDPVAFEIARTLNATIDQLAYWTDAVDRFAWQIHDGRLGNQIPPLPWSHTAGTPPPEPLTGRWKVATDRLNAMAQTITDFNRGLGCCIAHAADGHDYSRRVATDVRGEMAELKEITNKLLDQLQASQIAAV